jgi:LacI family transcriptional regulator
MLDDGNTAQVRSALRRIKQSTITVPDDLSLIVFDDNPWTELVSPALSVVRQPIDMLALHSVELAVSWLKGALTEPPPRIRVGAEFVQRSLSVAGRVPLTPPSLRGHMIYEARVIDSYEGEPCPLP